MLCRAPSRHIPRSQCQAAHSPPVSGNENVHHLSRQESAKKFAEKVKQDPVRHARRQDEQRKSRKKRDAHFRVITCSICHKQGHNRRSCPNKPPE